MLTINIDIILIYALDTKTIKQHSGHDNIYEYYEIKESIANIIEFMIFQIKIFKLTKLT